MCVCGKNCAVPALQYTNISYAYICLHVVKQTACVFDACTCAHSNATVQVLGLEFSWIYEWELNQESRIICDHGYIRAKEIGRHGQPSADFAAPCAEATHSFCGEAWPYSVRSLVVILADFGPANALVSVRCKSLDSGVAFWWLRPKHGGIFGEEFWAFGPQIFEGWCWACSIDLVWRDSMGY